MTHFLDAWEACLAGVHREGSQDVEEEACLAGASEEVLGPGDTEGRHAVSSVCMESEAFVHLLSSTPNSPHRN
jgi:hypothetical protein